MPDFVNSPTFRQGAFIFGVLLLLGAWKYGLEGVFE